MVKVLVIIGAEFRFAIAEIARVLRCSIAQSEIERVFSDKQNDQVSVKYYEFLSSSCVRVTGKVDEYEPGTIWLCVQGHRRLEKSLDLADIVQHAKIRAYRVEEEAKRNMNR